jgi:hypothetical protein
MAERRGSNPRYRETYMDGIQPDFGELFRPNKSIIDGENMFALNSAALRSSVPLVREVDARNLEASNIRQGPATPRIWCSAMRKRPFIGEGR